MEFPRALPITEFRYHDLGDFMKKMLACAIAVIASIFNVAFAGDCGAGENKELISETRALIINSVPMRAVVGEYPTQKGVPECVRFDFSIAPWGRAFNIKISDTSFNTAFEMAAFDAISKYRFKNSMFGFLRRYSLVFSGVDNKIPDNYMDKPN